MTGPASLGVFASSIFGGVPSGYFAGGNVTGSGFTQDGASSVTRTTYIEKINFSNETVSVLKYTLNTFQSIFYFQTPPIDFSGIEGATGFASTTAGYVAGGSEAIGQTSRVEKILFGTDSPSILNTGLSSERGGAVGLQSVNAGYVVGNFFTTGGNTVDKFNLVSDTRTTLASSVSNQRDRFGLSSTNNGYVLGGRAQSGSTYFANADKIAFSTDTVTTISNFLPANRASATTFSSSTDGYALGGASPLQTNTIVKLNFATDSASNFSSTLPANNAGGGGVASNTKGYLAGGSSTKTIYSLDFSNDSITTISQTLKYQKNSPATFSWK